VQYEAAWRRDGFVDVMLRDVMSPSFTILEGEAMPVIAEFPVVRVPWAQSVPPAAAHCAPGRHCP
jgi:hypothetical protein